MWKINNWLPFLIVIHPLAHLFIYSIFNHHSWKKTHWCVTKILIEQSPNQYRSALYLKNNIFSSKWKGQVNIESNHLCEESFFFFLKKKKWSILKLWHNQWHNSTQRDGGDASVATGWLEKHPDFYISVAPPCESSCGWAARLTATLKAWPSHDLGET